MTTIQAVVIDDNAPARLALGSVPLPQPAWNEALVRVAAVSLNRGEVNGAQGRPAGQQIGWDLAGTVEQAAADGSGPSVGTRVVGFLPTGGWAEVAAVPTHALAQLPDSVSFAQAATLPVAGLTALFGLEKRGSLLGRKVLITGASGGVGDFAVQLGRLAGAQIVAQVRSEERAQRLRDIGAHTVVVDADIDAATPHGPYDLVFDGVGGEVLSGAITQLALDGLAVSYGRTTSETVTFNLGQFFGTGGLVLYGFILFHEVRRLPAGAGLERLANAIASSQIEPYIAVEEHWSQVGKVAQRLLGRDYAGKAVLHLT